MKLAWVIPILSLSLTSRADDKHVVHAMTCQKRGMSVIVFSSRDAEFRSLTVAALLAHAVSIHASIRAATVRERNPGRAWGLNHWNRVCHEWSTFTSLQDEEKRRPTPALKAFVQNVEAAEYKIE